MQGTNTRVICYQEVVATFWGLLGVGFLLPVTFGSNNIQLTSGTALV